MQSLPPHSLSHRSEARLNLTCSFWGCFPTPWGTAGVSQYSGILQWVSQRCLGPGKQRSAPCVTPPAARNGCNVGNSQGEAASSWSRG